MIFRGGHWMSGPAEERRPELAPVNQLILNTATRMSKTATCWRLYSLLSRPRLLSVTYHRVGQDEHFRSLDMNIFRGQIEWLSQRFKLIRGDEVQDALDGRLGGEKIPLLITFDDGYRTLYSEVYPILRAMNIPAVVFLPTALIGTEDLLWTDQVDWAFSKTTKKEVSLPSSDDDIRPLSTAVDRQQASTDSKAILKSLPDLQRKTLVEGLLQELNVDAQPIRQMLNWDEVREIQDTIMPAAHSHSHPIMSRLDPDQVDMEVSTCRDIIKSETGVTPKLFAYPNGGPSDFDENCQTALGRRGYIAGFTTCIGANGASANPFALARLPTTMPTANDLARYMLKHLIS